MGDIEEYTYGKYKLEICVFDAESACKLHASSIASLLAVHFEFSILATLFCADTNCYC